MEKGNRLVFIVEGDCEVAFINKMIFISMLGLPNGA